METKPPKELFIPIDNIGCCAFNTEEKLIGNEDIEKGDKVAVDKLVEVKTFTLGLK